MSVAFSCVSSVCSACTGFDRVSKYLLEPRVGGGEVGAEIRLVVRQQREARRQEPQLQVLAQEKLLLRRQQRRLRPVETLDADQLP